MIGLPEEGVAASSDIAGRVREFFRPGGGLERASAGEAFAFELRPQQAAMAAAVADAILTPAHLAVEAGTGVGKTFAYLAPLILLAKARARPVAVSTQTINLQEQIVSRDIPFLRRSLGVDFTAALCKGRQNYLCLRRLARARLMGGDLFYRGQERELDHIRRWAETTEDGSLSDWGQGGSAAEKRTAEPQGEERRREEAQRSEVSGQRSEVSKQQAAIGNPQFPVPSPEVWRQVCSEHDNCLGRQCPHGGRCFLLRARRQAFNAELLILNHHLFFSDLALRRDGGGLLPDFNTLVLDEAHCLEDTAGEHLGLRLSQAGVEHWLRRLYTPESGKGLLAALQEGELAQAVAGLWDSAAQFFTEINRWAKLEGKTSWRVVEAPLAIPEPLSARLAAVLQALERRLKALEDADLQTELTAILRRGQAMRDSLDLFLHRTEENQVYWVEQEGLRRRQLALYSAPVEVGPMLESLLFGQYASVILTSATLAVGGSRKAGDPGRLDQWNEGDSGAGVSESQAQSDPRSVTAPDQDGVGLPSPGIPACRHSMVPSSQGASPLAYFRKRVGAGSCREQVLGSPFNYSRQMRVFVVGDMPDPSREAAFAAAAARAIPFFVRKSRGRAFVLFTSGELMRTVARDLAPWFEAEGILLLVQGAGLPRHALLNHFRRANEPAETPDPPEGRESAPSQSEIGNPQSKIRKAAVLFGLASFWMGVDVRGDALSSVIIVRLPFGVPDEPLARARMDRIRERGGDPFRDYSLPEAILRFRQGVGRLIRSSTDEGTIVILDPRVLSRGYGRHFLNALPECPFEVVAALESDGRTPPFGD